MTRTPSETGSTTSAHDIKEEEVADEIEPLANYGLSEKEKTVIKKYIKVMAPKCSN